MGKTCIVARCCNENKDGVSLFKFPKRKEIREQWIKQVKRTIEQIGQVTTQLSSAVISLRIALRLFGI